MKTKVLIIVGICLVWANLTYAQFNRFNKVGTTAFQFLKVNTTARAAAMGEAYSTIASSADAVFWNPANLVFVKKWDVSLAYLDWLLDIRQNSFAAAYNLGNWGVVAVSGMMNDIGGIEVTRADHLYRKEDGTYNPGLTGETIYPKSDFFGISYARYLTTKFAFGVSLKYAEEDLVVDKASTLFADLGFYYNTGYKSLKLAIVVRNFGPDITYVDKNYPLPQILNIGVSSYLIGNGDGLLLNSTNQKLLFSFDIAQSRDNSQQQLVGIEYSYLDILFLRGGYKFNFDEESWALGLGVRFKGMRLDYSYSDFGDYFNPVHRFTVGFGMK